MSQLEELRQIIVGDNTEQLGALRERIEDVESRTRDVAEVLAPAIDTTLRDDDRLITALKRPVSEGLKRAVRTEPEAYAEILYPAIAPSIRAAIAQAISSMLATINQTIESATTIGGLRARFESVRTGVPYAELLLRQSLIYRVERLYLIERESGLLISECGYEEDGKMDSDAVSAMFSAIQSFVQDSFSGDEEDRLTDFKVGSHTVWIAHGPKAMLACVLLGNAPESLKAQLYDTLDLIRTRYSHELNLFSGDTSEFVGVEDYLQSMLQLKLKTDEPGVSAEKTGWATKLVYALLLGLLAYGAYSQFEKHSKLATLNYHLDAAPGIVVTQSYWSKGQINVEGLKDPDARIPQKLLDAHGIKAEVLSLNMTPFRSLEVEMERRRFVTELNPPEGVGLVVEDGELMLKGSAPLEWLLKHDERLRQLAADKRLELTSLYATKNSAQQYLSQRLRIPPGASLERASSQLSQVAWVDVSFSNLIREILSNSRR